MTLSQDIIEYLHETFGDSYGEIARKTGISKAHISRVINRKRTLGLELLTKIQEAYEVPLPILLLQATKDENIPKNLKSYYKHFREALPDNLKLYKR